MGAQEPGRGRDGGRSRLDVDVAGRAGEGADRRRGCMMKRSHFVLFRGAEKWRERAEIEAIGWKCAWVKDKTGRSCVWTQQDMTIPIYGSWKICNVTI